MIPGPDCGHPCTPRAECCTPQPPWPKSGPRDCGHPCHPNDRCPSCALDELTRLSEEMGLYDAMSTTITPHRPCPACGDGLVGPWIAGGPRAGLCLPCAQPSEGGGGTPGGGTPSRKVGTEKLEPSPTPQNPPETPTSP